MTFIKIEPLKELENFERKVQDYLSNLSVDNSVVEKLTPRTDIVGCNSSLKLFLELPGVKKDKIKITVQDNILTVEGEKKNDVDTKENEIFCQERVFGSFKRDFTLPGNIDSTKIEAKFADGVLEITAPKLIEEQDLEKTIEVK